MQILWRDRSQQGKKLYDTVYDTANQKRCRLSLPTFLQNYLFVAGRTSGDPSSFSATPRRAKTGSFLR